MVIRCINCVTLQIISAVVSVEVSGDISRPITMIITYERNIPIKP